MVVGVVVVCVSCLILLYIQEAMQRAFLILTIIYMIMCKPMAMLMYSSPDVLKA